MFVTLNGCGVGGGGAVTYLFAALAYVLGGCEVS